MLRVVPHMTKPNEQNNRGQRFGGFSPLFLPEFSCSFQFFFTAVCQVVRRTTEEPSEQTAMDLEQLPLIWCDSFPFSLSTLVPVKTGLAGGQEWSDAIGLNWLAPVRRLSFGDLHFVSILNP